MDTRRTEAQEDESDDSADGSSNATSKGRTVTASAVVIGTSASIETKSAADDEAAAGDEAEPPGQLVLVPTTDYRPGLTVRVVDRLPAETVVRLLRLPNGKTVPVLTRPDEYLGYVARDESGGSQVYSTTVLFTRDSLETGVSYRFGDDVSMFSPELHLFRVTARRVDDDQ